MIYLTEIGIIHNTKNLLHADVIKLLQEKNRIALTPEEAEDLRNEIISQIQELNKKHPRCRPVEAYWESHKYVGLLDYRLYGIGNMASFSMLTSRKK